MAKHLARHGHRITILTSNRSGDGAVEGAGGVLRTSDLASTRLNWRALPARKGGLREPPSAAVYGLDLHAVPDIAAMTWLPFALPQAIRATRRLAIDCVITTSPPPSVHIIGAALKQLGAPWIADLRDGWTVDAPRPPFPLAVERRLDVMLERSLLQRADVVIGVTRSIVADLRDRLGVDARLLPNGYDPEERELPDARLATGLLAEGRHSLVHTGRASVSERTPDTLYAALRLMLAADRTIADRLEVVFAGPLSREEKRELSDPELQRITRWVGPLDRARALVLQQEANSLLVIATGPRERSLATGKLFEYLTAGPPILVIGDRSEAAEIVAETGTGFAVPAGSPQAIVTGINSLLISGVPMNRVPEAIARYSWEALAVRASELIEEVCARSICSYRTTRRG
jgi:glycosyltransferase involved in cell wall biosynthesis